MDLNGSLDEDDVAGFALALADPRAYETATACPATVAGDMDGDGDVDFDDIDDFVARVTVGLTGAAVAGSATREQGTVMAASVSSSVARKPWSRTVVLPTSTGWLVARARPARQLVRMPLGPRR